MASIFATLGPRARTVLRYLGFAVLGLVTFVFAFQLTFRFDRVKDKVIEGLSEKYDVTIADVDRSIIPGRMYFKAVSLRTRPTKTGEVATTFYIDELGVDLGLIAALRGITAVKLDARIGAGRLRGRIALGKAGTSIDIAGDDLPSEKLPMREALGLPMSGKVRLAFELEVPNETPKATGKSGPNWAKADGSVLFACPSGCSVGDGKSKLMLTTTNARQQEFLDKGGGGIDFGKVNIDSLFANVEVKSGKLEITRFDVKSSDGEVHIALNIALNQDINASQVTGCLRFRGSDALLKREPKTHAAISTTGGPMGPDNLFHIKLEGPLRQVRRLPLVCGPAAGTSPDNTAGSTPARPNLPATPEAPPRPPPGGMSPPPPSPPPPAAAPPPTPAGIGSQSPYVPPAAPVGEGPAPIVVPSPGGSAIPPSAAPPPPPNPALAPTGAAAPQ